VLGAPIDEQEAERRRGEKKKTGAKRSNAVGKKERKKGGVWSAQEKMYRAFGK